MNLFIILLAVALIAVLGSLVLGLIAMARGGEISKKYSNLFMRARIILQALALVLFLLALLSAQ